jgi:hypothetical protein
MVVITYNMRIENPTYFSCVAFDLVDTLIAEVRVLACSYNKWPLSLYWRHSEDPKSGLTDELFAASFPLELLPD